MTEIFGVVRLTFEFVIHKYIIIQIMELIKKTE